MLPPSHETSIPGHLLSEPSFWVPGRLPLSAWSGHIPFAFWLISELRPACFVELGAHYGTSYFAFCQAVDRLATGSRCFAVDTWEGDPQAGFYGEEIFEKVSAYNKAAFSAFSTLVRSTFDNALAGFADGSIDLLHIDGLHTYEAVRQDFENWLPKMSARGVILFHDTAEKQEGFGVHLLWRELAARYPSFEFTHSHGLGVLGVGTDLPRGLLALFHLKEPEAEGLRRVYEGVAGLATAAGNAIEQLRDLTDTTDELRQKKTENEALRLEVEALRTRFSESETRRNKLEKLTTSLETALEQEVVRADHLDYEKRATAAGLGAEVTSLNAKIEELERVIASFEAWQKVWSQRVFKRWHRFDEVRRMGFLRRLEKSFRRRWKAVLGIPPKSDPAPPAAGPEMQGPRGTGVAYHDWVAKNDIMSDPKRVILRSRIARMTVHPLISVVMPVYNSNLRWLEKAVRSVENQLYPNWELCIADDCSTDPDVRTALEGYARRDSRIRVVFRDKNGHICEASNSALSVACGDFVAFLDHDDELAEDALYHVAAAAVSHPAARLIYTDEDKITVSGDRIDPYFKGDWNPDLLFSHNYVCHLTVIRRDLLEKVGGFRTGVEGSQDYDLLLRCLPHLTADQIVHVPRILYHWRISPGSTALCGKEKSYASQAGLKVLRDHFQAHGPAGTTVTKGPLPNAFRVCWPIPAPAPLVSLLIPTRDRLDLLETAVRSILKKTTYQNFEIIILDNGSVEEETLAFYQTIVRAELRVRVVRDDSPFNYSAINNRGVTHARGSLIGLINNDIEVMSPGWLEEMVSHALRTDIGAVGAKLYYTDGRIQHGGVVVGLGGVAGHAHRFFPGDHPGQNNRLRLTRNLSAVTGACLIMRKEIFESVGGLDEEKLPVAFNDVDLCLKIRDAGYRIVWTPYAELLHHESASRGQDDSPEKIQRAEAEIAFMKEKWAPKLRTDPFYNPNLTLDYEDFSIAETGPARPTLGAG